MRSQAKPSGADVPNLPCLIGCLALAVASGSWAEAAHAEDARGAYLAKAADCGACHTAPHGKPFAGGLAIGSPVGTIYSTNITPSVDYGIGRYTEAQFAQAVRRGGPSSSLVALARAGIAAAAMALVLIVVLVIVRVIKRSSRIS